MSAVSPEAFTAQSLFQASDAFQGFTIIFHWKIIIERECRSAGAAAAGRRYVNASRNILHILRATAGGGPRPEAFHRSRTKYSEAPATSGLPLNGQSTLALLPVPDGH